jgi:membrane protease subunit (stomatin/prohibitin family)
MGLGTGLGMGFMIPQMMNQTMQQNNKPTNSEEDSFTKLKKLKELLDIGAIDQDEFNEAKKRILNSI